MKRFVSYIAWALIVAHALTETYMIVWKLKPETATEKVSPFYKKNQQITLLWYLKDASVLILWAITYFSMAQIAAKYSRKLFLVILTFFFYHVVDAFGYFYDYKQTRWFYLLTLGLLITAVSLQLFWKDKEVKYRSMI
jgi:hypothetical protein